MLRTGFVSSVTAILLALSTSAFPNDTLCNPSEDIVFSCPTEKDKTISVCASQSSQRVTYRFGMSNKIDLEIGAETSQKNTVVEYNNEILARSYNTFVRFKSGVFAYAVEQRWDGCPSSPDERCKDDSFFAGVTVYKSGEKVSRRECGTPRNSLDFKLLHRLNIPVSNHWPE